MTGGTLALGHEEAFYARAADLAGPLRGPVLDAGCGSGALLEVLRARGAAAFGVDLDPRRLPAVKGDLLALPFAPGAFEEVFCLGVLSYVPDTDKALRGFFRVLAPGGRLFLALPSLGFRRAQALKGRGGYTGLGDPSNRAFTRFEGRRMLADAGFRVLREEASGAPGIWKLNLWRKRLWFEAVKAPSPPPAGWAPLPVSVCMIAQNEAPNLAMSLGAVRGRVDDVLVLDGGSSDGTPGIARRWGARVERRAFDRDFAAQKNAAAALARHDWVLVLDADEYLEEGAWAHLAALAARGFDGKSAFAFPRRTRGVDGRFHRWALHYPNLQDRLFDRRRCRYVRPIHERLEIGGPRGFVPFHIVHEHSYEPSRVRQRVALYKGLERAQPAEAPSPAGERLAKLLFELKALYVDLGMPWRDPLFLARWTALRLLPPLRPLGDRTAWILRENAHRGLSA